MRAVRHLSYCVCIQYKQLVKRKAGWQRKHYTCIRRNSGSLYRTPDCFLTRNESPRRGYDVGFTLFVGYLFPRHGLTFSMQCNNQKPYLTLLHIQPLVFFCSPFLVSHSHSLRAVYVKKPLSLSFPILFLCREVDSAHVNTTREPSSV